MTGTVHLIAASVRIPAAIAVVSVVPPDVWIVMRGPEPTPAERLDRKAIAVPAAGRFNRATCTHRAGWLRAMVSIRLFEHAAGTHIRLPLIRRGRIDIVPCLAFIVLETRRAVYHENKRD